MISLDQFYCNQFPNCDSLTKEIVDGWLLPKPNEKTNGVKRRMIAIREFGKYLSMSKNDAYVLPSQLIGNFLPFTPYIYLDSYNFKNKIVEK